MAPRLLTRPYPGERPPARRRDRRASSPPARHQGVGGPLAAFAASIAVLGLSAGAALAPAQEEQVSLCHYTGSVTNPYVLVTIPPEAVSEHRGHGLDLIPAPAAGCPGAAPTPTPEPAPTQTPTPEPTVTPRPTETPRPEPTSQPTPGPTPAPTAAPGPEPRVPVAPLRPEPARSVGQEERTPPRAAPGPRAPLPRTGGEALVVLLLGGGFLGLGAGLRLLLP